jgi:hypothetical protein
MNPVRLKLFLALLWLIPGVGLLAYDWLAGQAHALRIGRLQLPIAWAFLLFGAVNLLRWWAARPARVDRSPWLERRRGRSRRPSEVEPDPNFRFDEPADGPR